MLPQPLLGLMGSEFTGRVACFYKWPGNLADRWVRVPCGRTFPGMEDPWQMLFLGLSWVRPTGLEPWRGAERSRSPPPPKCSHLGMFSRVYLVALRSIIGRGTSISCLSLICTFYSINTTLLEISCSHYVLFPVLVSLQACPSPPSQPG